MAQPVPYLVFDGACTEAMRFYAGVLGGTLDIMTNRQSPFAGQCQPEHLDRVMHARLKFEDGNLLYGGDCPPHIPYRGINGVSIALSFDTVGEAERVFGALSEGGSVMMPLGGTFWAKIFGMVTDRFGCAWAINGEPIDVKLNA